MFSRPTATAIHHVDGQHAYNDVVLLIGLYVGYHVRTLEVCGQRHTIEIRQKSADRWNSNNRIQLLLSNTARRHKSGAYTIDGFLRNVNVIYEPDFSPAINCRQPSFSGCRPTDLIWNDLPEDMMPAESLSTFCRRLKTHLFAKIS